MLCPKCSGDFRCVDTRQFGGGTVVQRRRVCRACGHRQKTFERTDRIFTAGEVDQLFRERLGDCLANLLQVATA
jgi:transcriptional regulator NrdR family protein